ncbi:MAG: NnrU family protein [Dongiaceae bacterium]
MPGQPRRYDGGEPGDAMDQLLLAASLFVGSHFALSSPPLRAPLAARLGERGFTGVYSVLQIVLLVWLVRAYAAAPVAPVWTPPGWTAWIPILAMIPALLLMVGGFVQPNPTAVLQDADGPPDTRPAGIFTITRHPVMWGFGLWALAHLCANGDLASIVLFGAVAVLALAGTLAIDAKKRARWGNAWGPFALSTSNLPLRAIAERRTRLDLAGIGWRTPAIAAVAYLALLGLHPLITGVSALPH